MPGLYSCSCISEILCVGDKAEWEGSCTGVPPIKENNNHYLKIYLCHNFHTDQSDGN